MSFADEDEFASFLSGESGLTHMTEDAFAHALQGFPLQLAEGRDVAWLAMAVRRALAISIPAHSDSTERMSNAETRKKLEQLTADVQSTWRKLFEIDGAVDSYLWQHAWGDESDRCDDDGVLIGDPTLYVRYQAAVREMDWASSFLRNAAKNVEQQKGPWKSYELRRLRVERGLYLATVFEAAYGVRPSANNHPSDARHKAPTAFMDFYKRVVVLAFGNNAASNLSDVLKEVCKKHAKFPAQFADGLIPGL